LTGNLPAQADSLAIALQALAKRTQTVFGCDCRLQCRPPVLVDDLNITTHLYRIAQEAVGNAIRHGKARRIDMKLVARGVDLVLAIEDDGIGLPTVPRSHHGVGLRNMQYRAGVIGGSLVIQRGANQGTTVVCTVKNALRQCAKKNSP